MSDFPALNLDDHEVIHTAAGAFADGIRAWGEVLAAEEPDAAEKVRAITEKQAALVAALTSELAKLDAELLTALGDDVSGWTEHYPALAGEGEAA